MNRTLTVALAFCCLLVTGCASTPAGRTDPRDPFERVNRAVFKFNDAIDRTVARPVARAYRKVTPDPVETGVSNFMDNITYPIVIVNDLLQGKFGAAARDTGRFLLNTTLGVGGVFDPATAVGLEENNEDFGQTLGVWGVPPGPYLMLPFLGPSTVRDGIGQIADEYSDPRNYIERDAIRYSILALRVVDTRARLLDADAALDRAFDRYAFVRNAYLQRREYLVRDGDVPEESIEDELLEELEEESGEEPEPQQ